MTLPIDPARVRLWLDGRDDSSFALVGQSVATWFDRSPHDRHFTQSVSAHRPTRIPYGIRCTGDHFLRRLGRITPEEGAEVFVVAAQVTSGPFFAQQGRNNDQLVALNGGHYLTHNRLRTQFNTFQVTSGGFYTTDWTEGRLNLIHTRVIASTVADVQVNANAPAAVSIDHNYYSLAEREAFVGAALGLIGSIVAITEFLTGDLYAVVVTLPLSTAERAAVYTSLANRFMDTDLPPALEFSDVLSGRVVNIGSGLATVTLFSWDNPSVFYRPAVSATGHWDAVWKKHEPFGVYYLSQDTRNPPIVHGPYTTTED